MCEQISDKQLIIEEVSYLLSLGFRENDKDLILLGMSISRDAFNDSDWSNIESETLRWHCANFFKIGKLVHEQIKSNPWNNVDRGSKLYQSNMRRWIRSKGFF